MNARGLLEALQPLVPSAKSGVTVLAYHLVGAGTESAVDIPIAMFTEQMAFLRATSRVVPLELALSGTAPVGDEPLVVLTFDDAYLNFRRVVWPILTEMGLPAILYVPVGFVSGYAACPIRGTTLPACSWDDLKALVGEGAAIGSHTVSHVNLARASHDVVERELRDSRKELETRLGV